MLEYVYGQNEIVAPAVAQLIPHCRRGWGPNIMTIGVVEGGLMIAGIVYHNWDPDAGVIDISAAALPGQYWLTRETLKRMYQYPFLQCGCQMVMNKVPADDERQLRMMAAFNYSLIRIPRGLGRYKDGVLGLLTREDWEANKICQRYRHHIVDAPVTTVEEAA